MFVSCIHTITWLNYTYGCLTLVAGYKKQHFSYVYRIPWFYFTYGCVILTAA